MTQEARKFRKCIIVDFFLMNTNAHIRTNIRKYGERALKTKQKEKQTVQNNYNNYLLL